jgi:hypothetical protein
MKRLSLLLLPLAVIGWVLVDRYYSQHIISYQAFSTGILLEGTSWTRNWDKKIFQVIAIPVTLVIMVVLVSIYGLILALASVTESLWNLVGEED